MIRLILLAASAAVTGAKMGHKALIQRIDSEKLSVIEDTTASARQAIKESGRTLLARTCRRTAANILVKVTMIAVLFAAKAVGLIAPHHYPVLLSGLLLLFLARDTFQTWPTARLTFRELSHAEWRPRQALSQVVAAEVFDQVLRKAVTTPTGRTQDLLLRVAGTSKDSFAREVATAVARLASNTSWEDLRPYIIWAGIRLGVMSVFYSTFVWVVVTAAQTS